MSADHSSHFQAATQPGRGRMTGVAVPWAPLWLCRVDRGPCPAPPSLLSGAGRIVLGRWRARSTTAPPRSRSWRRIPRFPGRLTSQFLREDG